MRSIILPFAVVLAVIVVGCGRGNLPETAPVSGTVTFNGKPLPGGLVTFHPEGEKEGKGNPAFGEVTNGKYSLTTYKKDDGAVLGKHVVTVEIFAGQDKPILPGTEDRYTTVPPRYSKPDTSPLRFQVQKGQNTADFTLKP